MNHLKHLVGPDIEVKVTLVTGCIVILFQCFWAGRTSSVSLIYIRRKPLRIYLHCVQQSPASVENIQKPCKKVDLTIEALKYSYCKPNNQKKSTEFLVHCIIVYISSISMSCFPYCKHCKVLGNQILKHFNNQRFQLLLSFIHLTAVLTFCQPYWHNMASFII